MDLPRGNVAYTVNGPVPIAYAQPKAPSVAQAKPPGATLPRSELLRQIWVERLATCAGCEWFAGQTADVPCGILQTGTPACSWRRIGQSGHAHPDERCLWNQAVLRRKRLV